MGVLAVAFDDDDFETEQDLRALQRAAEVKDNPARQGKVNAMIEKQRAALDKVTGDSDKLASDGFRRV